MLELRKFQEDDLQSLLELMNSFERVPMSFEEHLRQWQYEQTANAHDEYPTRLVAIFNGLVVGFLNLVYFRSHSLAQVGVILEARGKGIGTKLLAGMLESARLQNATSLKCEVMNLDAHDKKFLDNNGIKIKSKTVRSKLEVADFDPLKYQDLETKLIEEGYSFSRLADFSDTSETRENLYQLVRQSIEDDPGFEGKFLSLEEFEDKFATAEGFEDKTWKYFWGNQDFWWLALHNSRFVALAGAPGGITKWETGLTGVARTHRRRGLAQIVKVKSIVMFCQCGAKIIKTGNNAGNHAMISINRELGFKYTGDIYSLELLL
jgi:mycothiol synthase